MACEKLYTRVGIFIAGAMIILLGGITYLYDHYFHSRVESYVMFFEGSLAGLQQNSPITYRGVKIGEVRLIELTENKAKTNVRIPVFVEFFVEKKFGKYGNPIRLLIDNGVQANITSPNILTGTASIELIKSTRPSIIKNSIYNNYPIFPTMAGNDKNTNYNDALQSAQKAFNDISAFVKSEELNNTVLAIHNMSDAFKTLSINFNRQMPVSFAYFNNGLKQFSQTAYTTENLANYLYRHPESLLRGKP